MDVDMAMHHEYGHAAWIGTCGIDICMQYGHKNSKDTDMDMQYGHEHAACWTCNREMDINHGHGHSSLLERRSNSYLIVQYINLGICTFM